MDQIFNGVIAKSLILSVIAILIISFIYFLYIKNFKKGKENQQSKIKKFDSLIRPYFFISIITFIICVIGVETYQGKSINDNFYKILGLIVIILVWKKFSEEHKN